MSYAEHRKEQAHSDVNARGVDFGWEEEQCDLLHSGFLERVSGDDTKSVLFLSIWFTAGIYKCKLLDRQNHERCFINVGSLENLFQNVNAMLTSNELEWMPDEGRR